MVSWLLPFASVPSTHHMCCAVLCCFAVLLCCGDSLDSTTSNDAFGFGRLFNHSRRNANVHPIKCVVNNKPRLSFFSIKDIEVGTAHIIFPQPQLCSCSTALCGC